MTMKDTLLFSMLFWIIVANVGKIWPISKGDQYYQNLQKWYLAANKGDWKKADVIGMKLQEVDIQDFSKKNKADELLIRLNLLDTKTSKNPDEWMESAVLLYRLNKKSEAFKAIETAHKLDPIREDISKIYFTYQTSLLPPRQL